MPSGVLFARWSNLANGSSRITERSCVCRRWRPRRRCVAFDAGPAHRSFTQRPHGESGGRVHTHQVDTCGRDGAAIPPAIPRAVVLAARERPVVHDPGDAPPREIEHGQIHHAIARQNERDLGRARNGLGATASVGVAHALQHHRGQGPRGRGCPARGVPKTGPKTGQEAILGS